MNLEVGVAGWGVHFLTLKEGDTEEALPGHLSPSPPSPGKVRSCLTIQRGVVACVGTCLTYVPINTTP